MRRFTWHITTQKHSIKNSGHTSRQRFRHFENLYLYITDNEGNSGLGEASPLIGHSPESIFECKIALEQTLEQVTDSKSENALNSMDGIASVGCKIPHTLPSARFALETALLDRLARMRGIPLWQLWADNPSTVAVNTLIDSAVSAESVAALISHGIRVFKLKVGIVGRHESELSCLTMLRNRFGSDIQIRLDANRAFSADEAVSKTALYAPFAPAYIEEPFKTISDSPTHKIKVPFAADESLMNPQNHALLLSHPQCNTWVLKPSLQGGCFKTIELARMAHKHNRSVVITHMYESLPGFLALIHLATALHPVAACGLFPHAGLEPHQRHPAFQITNGFIFPSPNPGLGISPEKWMKFQ